MPGAYAHTTLVNEATDTARLESIAGFPTQAMGILQTHLKFCELGAVSPDYPYLDVMSSASTGWADNMHYERTGGVIREGIGLLRTYSGESQAKGLAWLLGYTAHFVTDVTIHPVIELKVGPYAQNKRMHRVCEMNQDTHIWQRLNLGDTGLSEHFDSGIGSCNDEANPKKLDADIALLWDSALQRNYPEQHKASPPAIHAWHKGFKRVDFVEEGGKLVKFARHVAVNCGLTYPLISEVDETFIRRLKTPNGKIMDYDDIFDKARQNVLKTWKVVASAVLNDNDEYLKKIGDWNLDTGKDTASGKFIFWA